MKVPGTKLYAYNSHRRPQYWIHHSAKLYAYNFQGGTSTVRQSVAKRRHLRRQLSGDRANCGIYPMGEVYAARHIA